MKKIVFVIIGLIIISGGWFGYQHFAKDAQQRQIISILPEDAIYILKTNQLTDAWKEVHQTNIWQHLITTKGFEFLQEVDTLMQKSLIENKATKYIFDNRPTLMAAYMTGEKDYDFVYVVDLQNTKYIKQIFDYILQIGGGKKVVKLNYNKQKIYKLKNDGSNFYITAIDNLLVSSFSYELVKKVIDEKKQTHWINQPEFVTINDQLEGELVQFYFNYDKLPDYAGIYFDNASKDLKMLSEQLKLSGFDISQDDERITMDGYTLLQNQPSYMNAMLDVKPGKLNAYHVISHHAALYTALGFKSFNLFYQSLLDNYGKDNTKKRDEYRKNIKKLESFLKIDLQKDLFDWIGQEIAIVKLRSGNRQKPADVVMLIEANDISEAQKGLQHISTQIKKRSPFKFKTYTYKNFPVYYLHQKGLFKTILGDLFKGIDKPYYTFIEDYVVFSNSEIVLKSFIDDYITGKTLSHDEDFMDFKDDLYSKANLQVYIQMPKLYDILQKSLTKEGKTALEEKKDFLLSFSRIGFQMQAKDDIFKTLLLIDHDEKALEKELAEQMAQKIDRSVHNAFFEDLQFKIFFPDTIQVPDGMYRSYYNNGKTIKAEGKVKDNLPQGIWRTYYPSGRLQSVVNYNDEGNVEGEMFYYFDQKPETKKVEANFDNDVIDGKYFEYWKNGAQKAKLYYKNGKLHGEAFYYYPSGKLKIKGNYRKGEKKGKWYFYNENGDLIKKKRYSLLIF